VSASHRRLTAARVCAPRDHETLFRAVELGKAIIATVGTGLRSLRALQPFGRANGDGRERTNSPRSIRMICVYRNGIATAESLTYINRPFLCMDYTFLLYLFQQAAQVFRRYGNQLCYLPVFKGQIHRGVFDRAHIL
jgi:hypothetical protein